MGRQWLLLLVGIGIMCIVTWYIYSYQAEGFQQQALQVWQRDLVERATESQGYMGATLDAARNAATLAVEGKVNNPTTDAIVGAAAIAAGTAMQAGQGIGAAAAAGAAAAKSIQDAAAKGTDVVGSPANRRSASAAAAAAATAGASAAAAAAAAARSYKQSLSASLGSRDLASVLLPTLPTTFDPSFTPFTDEGDMTLLKKYIKDSLGYTPFVAFMESPAVPSSISTSPEYRATQSLLDPAIAAYVAKAIPYYELLRMLGSENADNIKDNLRGRNLNDFNTLLTDQGYSSYRATDPETRERINAKLKITENPNAPASAINDANRVISEYRRVWTVVDILSARDAFKRDVQATISSIVALRSGFGLTLTAAQAAVKVLSATSANDATRYTQEMTNTQDALIDLAPVFGNLAMKFFEAADASTKASGTLTQSYTMMSTKLILANKGLFIPHVQRLYTTQTAQIIRMVNDLSEQMVPFNKFLQVDCKLYNNMFNPDIKNKCEKVYPAEVESRTKQIQSLNDVKSIAIDSQQNWLDMIALGAPNFINDFTDMIEPLPKVPNASFRFSTRPEISPTFTSLLQGRYYSRVMNVQGALSSLNKAELEKSAQLCKSIWLAVPGNMEKYIYIHPIDLKPYMRSGNPPDYSTGAQTAAVHTAMKAFQKGVMVTPAAAADAITTAIKDISANIPILLTAKQAALTTAQAALVAANAERDRLSRGELGSISKEQAVAAANAAQVEVDAAQADLIRTRDGGRVASAQKLSADATDQILVLMQEYKAAIASIAEFGNNAVGRIMQNASAGLAEPLRKNLVAKTTAVTQAIARSVVAVTMQPWSTGQLGYPVTMEIGSGNFLLNPISVALNTLLLTRPITSDELSFMPPPTTRFISKYIQTRSTRLNRFMTDISNSNIPAIQPTVNFATDASDNRPLYNQIAQGFYTLVGGGKTFSYIYDIFPIGKSILDVRVDITSNTDSSAAFKALADDYRIKMGKNMSDAEAAALTEAYQNTYAQLVENKDSAGNTISGVTRRLFYTQDASGIYITGMAADDMAATSFYNAYNGGLDTPTEDSPGNVNYAPIIQYTLNTIPTLDCTNLADLQMITRDYLAAIGNGDISGDTVNPWNGEGNLFVKTILGAKQAPGSLSCDIHWQEVVYDSTTNKPGEPVDRRVKVVYKPDYDNWWSYQILFDASGFQFYRSTTAITRLRTPITIPKPYIADQNLDDGGVCPTVTCSDPDTLYKIIDDYNSDDTVPGLILKVIKVTTMNASQCDIVADVDYTSEKGKPAQSKAGKVVRDLLSLYPTLDIASCTYTLDTAEKGYGIQENAPAMETPFDYMSKFTSEMMKPLSTATNTVLEQVGSAMTLAQKTLADYRAPSYAGVGDLETFKGCPSLRCHDVRIMNKIFQFYAADPANANTATMRKILKIGASPYAAVNSCDVMFENAGVVLNDLKGEYEVRPGTSQTTAIRVQFAPTGESSYDSILDAKIAATAVGSPERAALQQQKAALGEAVSCKFKVTGFTYLNPVDPSGGPMPAWSTVSDASNTSISVLNPMKTGLVNYSNPYKLPGGALTLEGGNSKCQTVKLQDISNILMYWGYDPPYAIGNLTDAKGAPTANYEIRITDLEFLRFSDTYQLFTLYRDTHCNPVIKDIRDSNFIQSALAFKVKNHLDSQYLSYVRAYFTAKLKPAKLLGAILESGYDYGANSTGLIYYGVSMITYDAEGNVSAFNGVSGNARFPLAYIACEFRQRFKGTSGVYVANVYFLTSRPVGISMSPIEDTAATPLPDPFAGLTQYKFLRFTPTGIRSATATKAQLQRIEFYSGIYIADVFTPKVSFAAAGCEIYTPDPGIRKSIQAAATQSVEFLYANDGAKLTAPEQNEVFLCPVGTAITVQSSMAITVDGLAFITGDDTASDVISWTLEGSLNGEFWKPIANKTAMIYPAYGYWRTACTSATGSVVVLPQNPNRLKGFVECNGARGLATLEFVKQVSDMVYTTFSQQYFAAGTAEVFDPQEKNRKRAYLTDISAIAIDDMINTIYLKPAIQILRSNYKLIPYSSATIVATYKRSRDCKFTYSMNLSTVAAPATLLQQSFPRLVLGSGQLPPFAWGGYPAALPSKYTMLSGKILEGGANLYSVNSFISNGPDRPAVIRLPAATTQITGLDAEGAAQMCADNTECIGFNYDPAASSGTFFTDPTAGTVLATSPDTRGLYIKKGYLLVQYVRLVGLKTRNPAATSIALSKIGFYKGNTLIRTTPQFIYSIGVNGKPSGAVETLETQIANLFNYSSANYWSSPTANVNGILMQFASPLVMSGYTLVTSSVDSGSDPVSWTLEVSAVGGDDPRNWTTLDTKVGATVTLDRMAAYPIFYFNGLPEGTSNDFIPKTLSSCNDPALIQSMVSLYKEQKVPGAGQFNVTSVGLVGAGTCVLGYNTEKNLATKYVGVTFNAAFGSIATLTGKNNMTLNLAPPVAQMSPISFAPLTPIRYARFIPLAVQAGGASAGNVNLTGIFLLKGGIIARAVSVVNPLATPQNDSVINAVNTDLRRQWSDAFGGYLILDYGQPIQVDAFTLFTGSSGAAGSPTRWTLEVSADGDIWQLAHRQGSDVTPPATAKTQYPVYSFTSSATTNTNILAKTLAFVGKNCGSPDILALVNKAAFAKSPSILFNPVSAVYTDSTNTCDYTQGDTSGILRAAFSTDIEGKTVVQTLSIAASAAPAPPGVSMSITGPVLESSFVPAPTCNEDTLLNDIDTFYRNTGINTSRMPLAATKVGLNPATNECVLDIDDQFAPLVSGKPVKQVGFQFEPRTAGSPRTITTQPPHNIKVNTNPATTSMISATVSPPYKYIRFKVLNTGSDAPGTPVMLGGFDFFKGVKKASYTATITNPLGSAGTDLTRWNDAKRKPLQFAFASPGLDFDGYSWTSSVGAIGLARAASDPVSWDLQASTNGILWTTIDSVRGAVKLADANSGFEMPIYKVGANGVGTIERDKLPVTAPSYTVDCRAVWPTAYAAYKRFIISDTMDGIDPGNNIRPDTYGYDAKLQQCTYKFDDNKNEIEGAIVGFRFNAANQIDTKQNAPTDSNRITVVGGIVADVDNLADTPLNASLKF
jgi:hypothetical protein